MAYLFYDYFCECARRHNCTVKCCNYYIYCDIAMDFVGQDAILSLHSMSPARAQNLPGICGIDRICCKQHRVAYPKKVNIT